MENKRRIGSRYEEMAAAFLREQQLVILESNFRCRTGEIDLVALDGDCLVFVEVKFRRSDAMGTPAEAVDKRKQLKIRNAARYYLYIHGHSETKPCRFDVVGILGSEITWIANAF